MKKTTKNLLIAAALGVAVTANAADLDAKILTLGTPKTVQPILVNGNVEVLVVTYRQAGNDDDVNAIIFNGHTQALTQGGKVIATRL